MFTFIKSVFRKNKESASVSVIDEYDHEAFSKFNEEDRILLLGHFSEEKKEYDLRSFHDESDALIGSLASFVLSLGLLVISKTFEIPSMLFLATAVFASYFSLASLLKTGRLKTGTMIFIFPFTMIVTTALIQYGADVNDINNGLSLIALGVSLMVISPQKRKERYQLKINKLKNDMLLEQDEIIRKQEKSIESLRNSLETLNGVLNQKEEMVEEMDSLKNDIDTLLLKTDS